MRIDTFGTCIALVVLTSSAAHADVFPLTEGVLRTYHYSNSQENGNYSNYFSGLATIEGLPTHVLVHSGGVDDGLQQFWSETVDGDKLLHGFKRSTLELHAMPPIVWVDQPLSVGKTWDANTTVGGLPLHIHFEVTELVNVTVPAGTFMVFRVQQTQSPGLLGKAMPYEPTGARRLTGQPSAAIHYDYADEVGLVLSEVSGRTDELVSVGPVAVQASTWSGVRALYR